MDKKRQQIGKLLVFILLLISQIQKIEAQTGNITVEAIEHNKYINGSLGMLIHSHLHVDGMANRNINIVAFIYQGYDAGGGKLYGGINGFRATDGQVCAFANTNCPYENTEWKDFKLFLPYNAITTPLGTTQLSFQIEIRSTDNFQPISRSSFSNFTITKNYNPQDLNSNMRLTPYQQQAICPYCNGIGYRCKIVATYGTQPKYTCPTCHKRTNANHVQQICSMCHGTGKL